MKMILARVGLIPDPEHLLGCVVLQSWQSWLLPVSGHPARIGRIIDIRALLTNATWRIGTPVVGPVRLLEASVVSNILPLSVHPIEGLVHGLGGVIPVLPNDAVGLLQELVLGGILPPVGQVSCVVVLPALVVKPVRYLVANHLCDMFTKRILVFAHPSNAAVVHVGRPVRAEEVAL